MMWVVPENQDFLALKPVEIYLNHDKLWQSTQGGKKRKYLEFNFYQPKFGQKINTVTPPKNLA